MRKHGLEEFLFRGLQAHGNYEPLDQFGDLGPDHVGPEELPRLGVEEGFDHPLILSERDRLSIGGEGKAPNPQLVSGGPRLGFRQPDAGDLRVAVGAARNFLAF